MVHRVSESRATVNDATPKLTHSVEAPMIDGDATGGDYHGRRLPTAAALVEAEMVFGRPETIEGAVNMSKVAERTVKNQDAPSTLGLGECKERPRESDHAVDEAIKRRIEENGAPAFYFSEVTYKCSGGKVWVCGRVPTDRLKQALWSLILDLDGVTEIDDQLDVVSSTGLSSICPR